MIVPCDHAVCADWLVRYAAPLAAEAAGRADGATLLRGYPPITHEGLHRRWRVGHLQAFVQELERESARVAATIPRDAGAGGIRDDHNVFRAVLRMRRYFHGSRLGFYAAHAFVAAIWLAHWHDLSDGGRRVDRTFRQCRAQLRLLSQEQEARTA